MINKREPLELQRTLFRGLGRGKRALEEALSRQWGSVAGVDEVGRGPLAGPVVAAAVILDPRVSIRGINDSKMLEPAKREELDLLIRKKAISFGIGLVGPEEIDRINILNASLKAMAIAVSQLTPPPGGLLVDGTFKIPHLPLPQQVVVKGDSRCRCIGAASIIAKVFRDRIMVEMDGQFPGYGFAEHKGYGAPTHKAALAKLGPTPIHRKSFEGVLPHEADEDQAALEFDTLNRAHLEKGSGAESFVVRHFENGGWRLLERNWSCRSGELDLVVSRGDVLAFVEVKMRSRAEDAGGWSPLDNMTPAKLKRLSSAARFWMHAFPRRWAGLNPRFDVVTVVGEGEGASIEHLEDAFEAWGG